VQATASQWCGQRKEQRQKYFRLDNMRFHT
jgi:hypothetical protein